MNKPIGFYSLSGGTANGLGGTIAKSTLVYSCMAAIWPSRTGETIQNMRDESKISGKLRIWYTTTPLTSDMEIHFGSRIFEIKGNPINPDEQNMFLDFIYWERV